VRISGFTFIRNGSALGYPFVSSIRSLLPLCDEIIVNVPRSTDDTLAVVRAIGDPKIKIIETEWDETLRKNGLILSHHTNLALEQCTGDWCVYIQGDEVLHEDSVAAMRAAMERELDNLNVQGLLVDYTHLYGSYRTQTCGFGYYYKEVRMVRRDPHIRSLGDAQGFRTVANVKLRVKDSGGHYFHYGHARHPELARKRLKEFFRLYHDDDTAVERASARLPEFYEDEKVKPFQGTHPAVMREIAAAADWEYHSRSPLIRFRKKAFWEDIAYLVKQCTGITLGVHKNYRIIR
jgi:glycosyltransferase involved in cell wall biosynthesis